MVLLVVNFALEITKLMKDWCDGCCWKQTTNHTYYTLDTNSFWGLRTYQTDWMKKPLKSVIVLLGVIHSSSFKSLLLQNIKRSIYLQHVTRTFHTNSMNSEPPKKLLVQMRPNFQKLEKQMITTILCVLFYSSVFFKNFLQCQLTPLSNFIDNKYWSRICYELVHK